MRGDMCSFDHGSDPVVLEGISGVLDFPPPPVPPGAPPGYTPAPAPPQGVPRPRHPPPRQQYGKCSVPLPRYERHIVLVARDYQCCIWYSAV